MKILHLTRQFYPCIGGVEKYIYEISKRLVKKGISCRVLTLNYNIFNKKQKFSESEKIDGIVVFRILGFGYYKKPIPLDLPVNLFKWADIVHIHDLRFLYETALLLKKFYKYKIVLSTHGFLLHTNDLRLIKNALIPFYYRPSIENSVDSLICVSKQDFEYFEKWKLKNLYLIENRIDFEKFNKVEKRSIPGRFLYFGRIDRNKGLDLLFKTLTFIKNEEWHLDIIGDGSEKVVNHLKMLATELEISHKITWHGFLPNGELLKFLSKSHLCFFPSQYEGFGFTLVEAMALGSICVANKIPTYESIVTDKKNGFLVDFFECPRAAQKIKDLLNIHLENFSTLLKFAKEEARRYDWEEKINQIVGVYQKVLR